MGLPATPCIYCGSTENLTVEHLLPKALGGNLTAEILCKSCNVDKLSSLDQALAENSTIALRRALHGREVSFEVRVDGRHSIYQPDLNLHLEVSVGNGLQPRLLPQVHQYNGLVPYAADDKDLNRLYDFLEKSSHEKLAETHREIVNDPRLTTPRFVLYRKNAAMVRAKRHEDAQQLLDVLVQVKDQLRQAIKDEPPRDGSIKTPTLQVAAALNLNRAHRGVAKIAFNMLGYVVSPEAMQHSSLNPIRSYILGDDVRLPERVAPDQVLLDERFVTWSFEPEACRPIQNRNTHQVLLSIGETSTFARVTLYKTLTYFVEFKTLEVTPLRAHVFEFGGDRHTNVELTEEEMFIRMREEDRERL